MDKQKFNEQLDATFGKEVLDAPILLTDIKFEKLPSGMWKIKMGEAIIVTSEAGKKLFEEAAITIALDNVNKAIANES